jgi:hypothetical protein
MKQIRASWFITLCAAVVLGIAAAAAEDSKSGAPPAQCEYPTNLTAAVYAPGTKNLLFRFTRSAARSGTTLSVQRNFTYPEGKLAASEHVIYHNDQLMKYELNEAQIGAAGSARIRRSPTDLAKGTIEFEYHAGPDSRLKTSTESLEPDTLIGDMIEPFLVSHWQALQSGEKVKCRYIVVPRLETVGFTFVKDEKGGANQPNVAIIRMEPTSLIIAALVKPIFFTMETAPPHKISDCTGRTVPKLQVNGKFKDLDAFTAFEPQSAR